jgi:photosystem II stability/assembly factor-like uncharacterized protein
MRLLQSVVLCVIGILVLAGCSSAGRASSPASPGLPQRIVVDDAQEGHALYEFQYAGRWERVQYREDGRTNGTSMRSHWAGAVAIMPFRGRRIWIYGVRGRNGGNALVSVDAGGTFSRVSFRAPRKITHSLIYESKEVSPGMHFLTIGVSGRRYVNIDGVEVEL